MLLGLAMIVLGTVMLVFTRQIYNFTGGFDFIESHFRAGTPAFIKLFALGLVLLGLLFATGLGAWLTEPIGHALDGLKLKN